MNGLSVALFSVVLGLASFGFKGSAVAQGAAADEPAVQPEPDDVGKDEPSESRFRWGISGAGGPLMGGYSGGAGGITTRFGYQVDSLLGFYGEPLLLVGAGASADVEGASAAGIALYGLGAMADITLGDFFYLAAGPELLLGAIGEVEASGAGTASAEAATGPFFSLATRAGFALGSVRPNRRNAFTIGLDMHVVFASEVAIMPLIALGYEAF
jgi:hypothetical protein